MSGGSSTRREVLDDLVTLGAERDQAEAAVGDEDFGVWPENWDAVRVFTACATQWRISAGHRTGLDYAALYAVIQMLGITANEDLLARIQVLEAEALKEFSWQARSAR